MSNEFFEEDSDCLNTLNPTLTKGLDKITKQNTKLAVSFIKKQAKFAKMKDEDLLNYFKTSSARQQALQQWSQSFRSGNPNWSIYDTEGYVDDCILCYLYPSQMSVYGTLKYLREIYPDTWKDLAILDDYNGIGLTTLHLLDNCNNVSFFNDVPKQIEGFQTLCEYFGHNMPKNDISRNKKDIPQIQYDVVFSLQVVEHYQNPIEDYLKSLVNTVKEGGLLVYMYDFQNNGDKRIGHFDNHHYFHNGESKTRIQINRLCKEFLNDNGFEFIEKFRNIFNHNPQIWRKIR
jgi:hypothetical protein